MTRLLVSLLAVWLLADTAYAGSSCAAANSEAYSNYVFRVYPDLSSLNFGSLTAQSGGGGPQRTLSSHPSNPFSGRQYGGGDRKSIYGTRAYGSGYLYGATNSSTIAGRPFPYGTWPISFGSYLGGEEVIGPNVDTMRPGGPLVTVQVGSTDTGKWPGLSGAEVYTMMGDRDSVLFMMGDLVNSCHATPQWPALFNTTSPTVKPETVIQYYRASSFALAYSGYNNSFALNNPSTSLSFAQSSPLPSNISSSAFLKCVNNTIGTILPIIDGPVSPPTKLSKGAIAGIVIGSVIGFVILMWLIIKFDPKRQRT